MSNEMINTYTKMVNNTLYYVHHGYCDGRPTKWITLSPWDSRIRIKIINMEACYFDSKGDTMLVYEDDEPEWDLY